MLGNYVQYFVMFTLSQAYDILSCDFLENAAAPALAGLRPASAPGGLWPPGGRGALGKMKKETPSVPNTLPLERD